MHGKENRKDGVGVLVYKLGFTSINITNYLPKSIGKKGEGEREGGRERSPIHVEQGMLNTNNKTNRLRIHRSIGHDRKHEERNQNRVCEKGHYQVQEKQLKNTNKELTKLKNKFAITSKI